LYKKAQKVGFKGEFKFMGLIKVSSLKIASLKYLKRKVKIYTEDKKKKQEQRYAFVDFKTGSFYIVRKPSITEAKLNKELSFFVPESQNWKSLQAQLRSGKGKKDKYAKKSAEKKY
jgi:hypothetical protein